MQSSVMPNNNDLKRKSLENPFATKQCHHICQWCMWYMRTAGEGGYFMHCCRYISTQWSICIANAR